jgi:hypothetical protein
MGEMLITRKLLGGIEASLLREALGRASKVPMEVACADWSLSLCPKDYAASIYGDRLRAIDPEAFWKIFNAFVSLNALEPVAADDSDLWKKLVALWPLG